jgi:dienelactone hydrolase
MTTAILDPTEAAAEPPFEAARRLLLGDAGSITHVGNIGYTFGGGGMGLLARRYGMAAAGTAIGPRPHRHSTNDARRPAAVQMAARDEHSPQLG